MASARDLVRRHVSAVKGAAAAVRLPASRCALKRFTWVGASDDAWYEHNMSMEGSVRLASRGSLVVASYTIQERTPGLCHVARERERETELQWPP